MKKNLLLVLGITFAISASAQVGIKHSLKLENKPVSSIENFEGYYNFAKNNNFTPKAGGDVLWTEDFSDITASGWTIDNGTQTGNDQGWATVTSSRTWASGNGIAKKILSTSGGNFLEVMNGKYTQTGATSPINVTYTATSPAITIPNPDVTVSFLQYGALFNDSQTMEVSVDGNNWIEVFSNNDRTTFVGNNPSAIYANPETATANLGFAGLPAATTTIYLRFKFTSRYSTDSNPMAWLTFGWMIDDMEVVENYGADLKLQAPLITSAGIRYSIVPASQGHEVAVVNSAVNNGSQDLNDVVSYTKFTTPTGEVFDTLLGAAELTAYNTDTIVHSIVLADSGTYTFSDFGVYFNGTDERPENDTTDYTYSIEFGGDYTYALDLGVATSYDTENENAEYHIGNVFDIYSAVEITGVDVYLYASGNVKSNPGTEMFASIRDYGGNFDEITRTENLSIESGYNNKWITLVFEEPVSLNADQSYVATVGTYGTADPNNYDLVVGVSGESLRGSSLAYYGSASNPGWFIAGNGGTPMVRMNFTPGIVSTKNLNESVKANIYPNPAKDAAVIDYNTAFDGNVTISVVDLSGRTVYTTSFANQAAGNNKVELNTSDFNAGVYQVVISANSSTITKKLVIR